MAAGLPHQLAELVWAERLPIVPCHVPFPSLTPPVKPAAASSSVFRESTLA
jgi:hypothetical protein